MKSTPPRRAGPRRATRHSLLGLALLSVIASALLACSGCGGASSSSATESGSARPPAGLPVRIVPIPRLSVGVTTGDTARMFTQIVSPFSMRDGRMVVPDAGAGVIRLFDSDGGALTTFGREGEGPGELRSIRSAWARGDTVEVFDGRLGRVTRFFADGPPEVVTLEGGGLRAGPFGDGWVVAAIVGTGADHRDDWALVQYGPTGERIREVTHILGMNRYDLPGMNGPGPLSPRQAFTIHGDRLYAGETMTPAIRVWKPDGTLEREITWQPAPSPSAEDVLAEVLDSAVARSETGRAIGPVRWQRPQDLRRYWEAAPIPDHVSVFWDLRVDARGFVWIRPYEPLKDAAALGGLGGTAPGGTWLIATPAGGVVGSVNVPDALVPTQITEDAVVGIARDSLGVESVRVYPLERAAG